MTYFLKVTEDYEFDNEFTLKLANWLSNHVSGDQPFNELNVHYGFQFLDESVEDNGLKKLWKEVYSEYTFKYDTLIEAHFGFKMPSKLIASIHKVHCDEWVIWRIDFCYIEEAPTSGMYFYAIEVDDMYMVQFRLSEM
jgi:hypothetical protein